MEGPNGLEEVEVFSFYGNSKPTWHTDLDDPIISKKLLLYQNVLQLNKKCLNFIVKYFLSPLLSIF